MCCHWSRTTPWAKIEMPRPGSLDVEIFKAKIKGLLPTLKDWKDSFGAIIRGSFLGFFCGLIPGAGVTVASLTSYGLEKKLSKHPEKFGSGVIEGVAGPEAANNAASSANFIPLFTLGIPCGAITAMLLAVFVLIPLTEVTAAESYKVGAIFSVTGRTSFLGDPEKKTVLMQP